MRTKTFAGLILMWAAIIVLVWGIWHFSPMGGVYRIY